MDGDYGFGGLTLDEFKQLWERLRTFEEMNVTQLQRQGSYHALLRENMPQDVVNRLVEKEMDDVDELRSFRITAKCRLWCARYDGILLVLWWDRKHQVNPVKKKHT